MSKKKVYIIFLFFIIQGCASFRGSQRTEEYMIQKEGEIPFVLLFPAGSELSEENIKEINKKTPLKIKDLWILARYNHLVSREKDHFKTTEALYKRISLEEKNYSPMALTNLGCLLSEMKRYSEAEKIFQKLVAENSPNITTYYNLSMLYKYSGLLEDRIKVLSVMKERFPGDIYAYIELGDIFQDKGKYDISGKLYLEALNADQSSYVPLLRMAKLLETKNDLAGAEKYYKQCIRDFPDIREAYIEYSRLLLNLNRRDEAKKILNNAVDRFKD